jgi:hypothetical protein
MAARMSRMHDASGGCAGHVSTTDARPCIHHRCVCMRRMCGRASTSYTRRMPYIHHGCAAVHPPASATDALTLHQPAGA